MVKRLKTHKSFGGQIEFCTHHSRETGTDMSFSIYLPTATLVGSAPVIYWLSGLTCNEENFTAKSGFQQYAEEHGLIVVAPDTSPRGAGIDGEDKDWDFGTGAGFYVDATEQPWSKHYRMYSYITSELPEVINKNFPIMKDRQSIMGHSMGGHGALVIGLRNVESYRSASAFAPICSPTTAPWGEKAFTNYLGDNKEAWHSYDTCSLIANSQKHLPILVDQGMADPFLKEQLQLDQLENTCTKHDYPIIVEKREGYDHSYFYIASFLEDHFRYHARFLKN